MNLEEIKAKRQELVFAMNTRKLGNKLFDWLIAEVERLEKDMPILMHLQAYNDIKKAVAARCIDLGTPEAIKKEFGL